MPDESRISIIVPCLNEAAALGRQLQFLERHRHECEVVVVDGGSKDGTVEIARASSWCRVLETGFAQRSFQMNHAAVKATGDILLFLHADTQLPEGFVASIRRAMEDENAVGGSFYIRFDHDQWFLRFITFLSKQNIRWITFGDHAMFFRREVFSALGGFPAMPILEDLELQLRARKKGTMVRISKPVITSARRFVNNGILRQVAIDAYVLFGYYLGISPYQLVKSYSDEPAAAR